MSASVIRSPGARHGPCLDLCIHQDCLELRAIAAAICPLCQQPIGYDNRFYRDQIHGLVHAICLEDYLQIQTQKLLQSKPEQGKPLEVTT